MKRLQSRDLRLNVLATIDMEEINSLKALENPAYGRAIGLLIDLLGNDL
jgi:hypothetical protein